MDPTHDAIAAPIVDTHPVPSQVQKDPTLWYKGGNLVNRPTKKPITPPLSKTRLRKYATSVEYESELGFDMRQCKEVPLQLLKADRNIEAFYGYNTDRVILSKIN